MFETLIPLGNKLYLTTLLLSKALFQDNLISSYEVNNSDIESEQKSEPDLFQFFKICIERHNKRVKFNSPLLYNDDLINYVLTDYSPFDLSSDEIDFQLLHNWIDEINSDYYINEIIKNGTNLLNELQNYEGKSLNYYNELNINIDWLERELGLFKFSCLDDRIIILHSFKEKNSQVLKLANKILVLKLAFLTMKMFIQLPLQ